MTSAASRARDRRGVRPLPVVAAALLTPAPAAANGDDVSSSRPTPLATTSGREG